MSFDTSARTWRSNDASNFIQPPHPPAPYHDSPLPHHHYIHHHHHHHPHPHHHQNHNNQFYNQQDPAATYYANPYPHHHHDQTSISHNNNNTMTAAHAPRTYNVNHYEPEPDTPFASYTLSPHLGQLQPPQQLTPPPQQHQQLVHHQHIHEQSPAPPMRHSPKAAPAATYYAPVAAALYSRTLSQPPSPPSDPSAIPQSGAGADHYPSSSGVPRLPPILQVEKQQVTTSATQLASASRRRNEAHFVCPVPGCGSTFTRRFNLRGHLRSHTEERPYVCEWPGCNKGFARQHDCKRHQALHSAKSQTNVCRGCKKTFSRLDALNRHLKSDGGADCRPFHQKPAPEDKRDSS